MAWVCSGDGPTGPLAAALSDAAGHPSNDYESSVLNSGLDSDIADVPAGWSMPEDTATETIEAATKAVLPMTSACLALRGTEVRALPYGLPCPTSRVSGPQDCEKRKPRVFERSQHEAAQLLHTYVKEQEENARSQLRLRRQISNRESARRARKRKEELMQKLIEENAVLKSEIWELRELLLLAHKSKGILRSDEFRRLPVDEASMPAPMPDILHVHECSTFASRTQPGRALLQTGSAAAISSCPTLRYGIDLPGNDLAHFDNINSPSDCCAMCALNINCKGFVWIAGDGTKINPGAVQNRCQLTSGKLNGNNAAPTYRALVQTHPSHVKRVFLLSPFQYSNVKQVDWYIHRPGTDFADPVNPPVPSQKTATAAPYYLGSTANAAGGQGTTWDIQNFRSNGVQACGSPINGSKCTATIVVTLNDGTKFIGARNTFFVSVQQSF
ncbi:hypothetical protein WJX72_012349 [[Myrmecia] bisecta]|uniref:BZIP domain-containing protein n=1 Tax=[Myrmecia] bisecta TaxID=41462 RepID=A0AAW1RA53_9CHLO